MLPTPIFPERPEDVPETARVDARAHDLRYLIGGEVRTWRGPSVEVRSPIFVGGERAVLGRLPMIDEAEALAALDAARRAWDHGRGEWPTMTVAGRIACVERFAARMTEVREELVRILMWEICKSRKDAETEVDRTVVYIRATIEALKEVDRAGGRFQIDQGYLGQIRRSPLGIILCMGPFNYPLNETFTTLIPALIMGNTIVSKLPRYGGLCHLPLLPAFAECFPAGTVNIFQGDGATVIGPIMKTGDVDCLAFIGSSRVANLIERQHPRPNRLRVITGLEAKNPAIILPDADLDVAVRECVSGALSYNGQRCTALKLLLAHESIADAFAARVAERVAGLRGGLPWTPGVQVTPMVEEDKTGALRALVDDATAAGARLLTGGEADRTFFSPAVLYPTPPGCRLYHEEQFGPVVPVARWSSDDDLEAFTTASPYGQQVSIFGRDPARIGALVDIMTNQVSRINLNTQCRRGPDTFPFTGRKDSAEGTLSVSDALRAFSIRTVCATDMSQANKALVNAIVSGHKSAFLTTDFIL